MKNFIKNILSSCLGSMIALILVFGLFFVAMIGMVSFFSDMSNFQSNSPTEGEKALLLELPRMMPELTNNVETSFDLSSNVNVGTQDVVRLIKKAEEDKNIEGIILRPETGGVPYSSLRLIRNALEEFKESGKFIYSYADYMSQKNYYMASVADSVFLNPNGTVSFEGMGMLNVYFKDALNKLDIEPEIFYVGNFKSATEPLRRNNMSEEDRHQRKEFLEALFNTVLEDISRNRLISVTDLRQISDEFLIRNAEDAIAYKLVDQLAYYSEFNNALKSRMGLSEDDTFSPYNIQAYYGKNKTKLLSRSGEEIAVVYAEGSITDGDDTPGSITNDQYVRLLRKLRFDDNIKGIVLRVDSPGGSALVSDNIWHEIEQLKAAGKKVVVSMGTYAASGGYYISCNADYIYAEPTTLTGSIGVFGVMMNTGKFFNNKLGITFDTVQTGKFTNSFTAFFEKNEEERAIIQQSVEDVYDKFIERVADGRNLSREDVEALAQGHIYSGVDALELNLVDELGDINEAVNKVAELLEIEEYKIREYPKLKSPIEQFLKQISGQDAPEVLTKAAIPEEYRDMIDQLKMIQSMDGVQARLPYMVVQ